MLKAIDGGLACNACKDLHAKKGHNNPGISFLVDWSISIKKCIEHHTREALIESDIEDVSVLCIPVIAVSMKEGLC